jgi:hypothetical protein
VHAFEVALSTHLVGYYFLFALPLLGALVETQPIVDPMFCIDRLQERTFSAVDNQDDVDILDPWRLMKDGCVLGGMLQWYE